MDKNEAQKVQDSPLYKPGKLLTTPDDTDKDLQDITLEDLFFAHNDTIGKGTYSTVVKAVHRESQRPLALK